MKKELQRKVDEVNLRKEVIDSMSDTLMKHEKNSAELTQKLAMMKNQIMEKDAFKGMGRKYAGIKICTMKDIPVYVTILSVEWM